MFDTLCSACFTLCCLFLYWPFCHGVVMLFVFVLAILSWRRYVVCFCIGHFVMASLCCLFLYWPFWHSVVVLFVFVLAILSWRRYVVCFCIGHFVMASLCCLFLYWPFVIAPLNWMSPLPATFCHQKSISIKLVRHTLTYIAIRRKG